MRFTVSGNAGVLQIMDLPYDVGGRQCRKWGMQLVHWVHVYVKVNLIMLIKKEHSGLNKPVYLSKQISVRVKVSGGRVSDDLVYHSAAKRVKHVY